MTSTWFLSVVFSSRGRAPRNFNEFQGIFINFSAQGRFFTDLEPPVSTKLENAYNVREIITCVEFENHRTQRDRGEPGRQTTPAARCAEELHQGTRTSDAGGGRTSTGEIRLASYWRTIRNQGPQFVS